MSSRKYVAEFIGTFLLVFLAVGAAVMGLKSAGILAVATAFGFVLVFVAYAFGPVSGAHVNPAVTIAMVVARKMPIAEAAGYWVAQVAGAIVGAGVLKLLVSSFGVVDETGALGTNGWADPLTMGGAFILEMLLTFAFVLVILLVTDRAANGTTAGLAIGVALTVVHLVGIPNTGTSVNPARSIGPALFSGAEALSALWVYIVGPVIGGALAGIVAKTRIFELD